MANVIVDIYVTPIGTGSTSLSEYVAETQKVLQRFPAIKAQLNPMSTTLEGSLDDILTVVREIHEAPFSKGALRVSTTLRIDDRRDGTSPTMAKRVDSVQAKL